jgi:hypothetical protein
VITMTEELPASGDARADTVDTVVTADHGLWHVDVVVVFTDGVVRRRVGTYRTERLAHIAADLIKRGAEREIQGPGG